MTETLQETPLPQVCAARILEISGTQHAPDEAAVLWPKILQHKWLMSEKHGRDVGLRAACIDFDEHMDQATREYTDYRRKDVLNDLGAQAFKREIWDTISDSPPPKQLVRRRIILPLTERDLSVKHGVIAPKTIIFFGPLGTGKTHFVKAIVHVSFPTMTRVFENISCQLCSASLHQAPGWCCQEGLLPLRPTDYSSRIKAMQHGRF